MPRTVGALGVEANKTVKRPENAEISTFLKGISKRNQDMYKIVTRRKCNLKIDNVENLLHGKIVLREIVTCKNSSAEKFLHNKNAMWQKCHVTFLYNASFYFSKSCYAYD